MIIIRITEASKVGEKLRQLRINRGMTQQDVATRASMPIQQYGQIERGEHVPRVDTLDRLLDALRGQLLIGCEARQ